VVHTFGNEHTQRPSKDVDPIDTPRQIPENDIPWIPAVAIEDSLMSIWWLQNSIRTDIPRTDECHVQKQRSTTRLATKRAMELRMNSVGRIVWMLSRQVRIDELGGLLVIGWIDQKLSLPVFNVGYRGFGYGALCWDGVANDFAS
jgi:hypothetical protein